MGEWLTYSLIDFMPMEPEVYFRLFVRQNHAVWPAQVPALMVGAVVLWLAARGNGRGLGPLLGACWLFTGITFYFNLYAELNPAAVYAGWVFVVQALLLAGYGVAGRPSRPNDGRTAVWRRIGLVVGVLVLIIYPLLGPLAGRSWQGLELFDISPDPTALMTLAVAPAFGRRYWALMIIPLLWCLFSGATWYAMGWYPGLIVPASGVLFVSVAVGRYFKRRTIQRGV